MTRVKNLLLGTVGMAALSSFAPSAYAADMAVKAFDDLTVKFYGTLDVNAYCQDHGTQAPGDAVPSYFLFANTFVGPNQFCSIGSNGLSVSNVGFTAEKPIGYGITAIGRAETFFSPLTGQVLNGVGTVAKANTMVFGNQVAYGDSNSAGQLLNGDVYAGLSSKTFGTVTVGRLKSLNFDDFLLYDPFAQSLAFSMIGYYGGGAGTGDTEDRRWDNSAKWVWDQGPFHVAAQGSTGCNDCGQQGAWGADVGLRNVLGGLSVDAAYTATKGAVSAPGILLGQGAGGTPAPFPGVSLTQQLLARISDNKEWTVQGKYVWNLPGWGSAGMYTKAAPTPATFTLYGGWLHIEFNDPTNPLSNGQTTLGNYVIGVANNFRYLTPQVQDWFWAGGKYAVNQWSFTGAYYYQQHNTFQSGNGIDNLAVNAGVGVPQPTGVSICNPATVTAAKQGGVVFAAPSSNCSGYFQSVAFVIDYAFNKNVDIYTGVNYNDIHGGYLAGQQVSSQITGTTGLRFRF